LVKRGNVYIVEEVIEVDELDKGNISAALGKAELAELCHTLTYTKSNQIFTK